MDNDPNYRWFAWKVLQQDKLTVGATTYIRNTALAAPPFFDNVVRKDSTTWGSESLGPRVIDWTGLSCKDQATILPTLQRTSNWIVLALAGKSKLGTTPLPVDGSFIAMTTKGKVFRKRQWWPAGHDELAAYDRKVEVCSRHNILKNQIDELELLLNSSSAKDIPHNGAEEVEGIWEGTGTKAKREASAKWAETKKAHPPTGRNMQRHASPSRRRSNTPGVRGH